MNFDEYQKAAASTAVYPNIGSNLDYPTLGLCSEAGEVAGVIKKVQRDHGGDLTPKREQLIKELGGVLWYAAQLATEAGLSLQDIAGANVGVLAKRQEEGTLQGNDADDELVFRACQFTLPDSNGRVFTPGCFKIPEGGLSVKLHHGVAYGTDLPHLMGTGKMVKDDSAFLVGDVRLRADTPVGLPQLLSAIQNRRVHCSLEGEVIAHEAMPDDKIRVTQFNPSHLSIHLDEEPIPPTFAD